MFAGKYLTDPNLKKQAALIVARIGLKDKTLSGKAVRDVLQLAQPLISGTDSAILVNKLRAHLNAMPYDHGFVSLFNGKDLTGWKGPVDQYEVVDGAIYCKQGKGGTLHTVDEFSDFKVRAEFKLPPGGNNGFAIRYPGTGNTAYVGMCELQVLDDSAEKYAKLDPRQYHGSVYGIVAAHRGYQRPVGEWNFEEVTVEGSRIRVELNGTVIVDADVSQVTEYMANSPHPGKERTSGHFGFAGHSDPVGFRALRVLSLK